MALADLGDELTPDFDLGRGVQLQVGAQTYDVLLQGDLSLRLRTPAGKLVRSLPALDDEGLRTGGMRPPRGSRRCPRASRPCCSSRRRACSPA
ncbi:hypothetical protein ACHFCA_13135 [Delftia tsuruhatensis]